MGIEAELAVFTHAPRIADFFVYGHQRVFIIKEQCVMHYLMATSAHSAVPDSLAFFLAVSSTNDWRVTKRTTHDISPAP
jgi:hypothetical protein